MVTIVVGGARSGKSSFAESIFQGENDVVYIATTRPEDEEMEERVVHHRKNRPDTWRTFEGNYNIADAVGSEKHYILDCITVLTSNIMFDMSCDVAIIDGLLQKEIEDKVLEAVKSLIDRINASKLKLVMVTNEVGCSIVPENHVARVYRDIAGRVNQRAAELADEAYAVICGIPVKLK